MLGFGGPPTHIAMLRALCVERERWLTAEEFNDGIAAVNVLPGPASTQLAIWCGWRLRGVRGALIAGAAFIVPGLVAIVALAEVFLASHPPRWIDGAAAGAGAAVPAVALQAAGRLLPASWARAHQSVHGRVRWVLYAAGGAVGAALAGPWLVVVIVCAGAFEVAVRHPRSPTNAVPLVVGAAVPAVGGLGAVAWVALKVGALAFGGGFVIVPLMQHDAVAAYHWMTNGQFLNAVALGQVTPGPVVQTVAVVGFAADGLRGAALAAAVVFTPSFLFVIFGGRHFDRLRADPKAQSVLTGAGAAAIGAIGGAAIPLGLALAHLWQLAVLGAAVAWLVAARRGVVTALLVAGALGVAAAAVGLPVGR